MFHKTVIAVWLSVVVALVASAQTTRVVHFNTTDYVGIAGTYYPVDQPHVPAVLLIHSVHRDRNVWADFATLLQHNGLAVLAIDLRGHGESDRKLTAEGPVKIDSRDLTSRDYQDMLLDVEAAVNWLQAQPGIDGKHVALIGESVGANIALRYAAVNEDLAAVVLFSPGINYRGIRTDDVMHQFGRTPFHIFVSQNDAFAFESSKQLIEIHQELGTDTATNELTVCTGSLHGAEMLKSVRNLPQMTLAWLKEALVALPSQLITPPPPVSKPAPAPAHETTAPAK